MLQRVVLRDAQNRPLGQHPDAFMEPPPAPAICPTGQAESSQGINHRPMRLLIIQNHSGLHRLQDKVASSLEHLRGGYIYPENNRNITQKKVGWFLFVCFSRIIAQTFLAIVVQYLLIENIDWLQVTAFARKNDYHQKEMGIKRTAPLFPEYKTDIQKNKQSREEMMVICK